MKLILLLVTIFSVNTYAADGSSGCGPGWFVSKKNSLLSSALRATTNAVLFPSVTLGMTLGTSNCTKHSIVKNEVEDLKFATENYFEIAADASKGNGAFLTAYGELMGCHGENTKIFKNRMQENFNQLFDKQNIDPTSLVKETYKVIIKDPVLFQSCFAV
ncbi:MAG: DUF3015 family protein [Halobacteriovoraceae bacterium]|jgi:hypothetical protein|nr:DUF3015 family protein [Halobacteriovoraceae bacterium]